LRGTGKDMPSEKRERRRNHENPFPEPTKRITKGRNSSFVAGKHGEKGTKDGYDEDKRDRARATDSKEIIHTLQNTGQKEKGGRGVKG